MSNEEIEAGKNWVEKMLSQHAQDLGLTIRGLEWGWGAGDFDNNRLTLSFSVDTKRCIEKFSVDDLADVPNTRSVQVELNNLLKKLVESSLEQSKKTGF